MILEEVELTGLGLVAADLIACIDGDNQGTMERYSPHFLETFPQIGDQKQLVCLHMLLFCFGYLRSQILDTHLEPLKIACLK